MLHSDPQLSLEVPTSVQLGVRNDAIAVGSPILARERIKSQDGSSSPLRGEIEDEVYTMFPDLISKDTGPKAPGRMTILESTVRSNFFSNCKSSLAFFYNA